MSIFYGKNKYVLIVSVYTVVLVAATWFWLQRNPIAAPSAGRVETTDVTGSDMLEMDDADQRHKLVGVWWGEMPEHLAGARLFSDLKSNVKRSDYAGADSCKECHQQKHAEWSKHPHRWMNAVAGRESIRMPFDGRELPYKGGIVKVFQEDDAYKMRLTRDGASRTYRVNQTIGSRFFQYFVGKLEQGQDGDDTKFFDFNHLLPIGYRIKYQELVPVVHVSGGDTDKQPDDPYQLIYPFTTYSDGCTKCHTTPSMNEWFMRHNVLHTIEGKIASGTGSPTFFSLDAGKILRESFGFSGKTHGGGAWEPSEPAKDYMKGLLYKEAKETAVSLGISCEACHLGCKEHVDNPKVMPRFFPSGQDIYVYNGEYDQVYGRNVKNLNWICGRCHTGGRPYYLGGMATWNSIEHKDAMGGHCYSELTCIHCHDPHKRIGDKWPLTPMQDDALCISCHFQYESEAAVVKHTHHPYESTGSRCMNCHMPKINEGLEHVVRTHMIYSPAEKGEMLMGNEPNACNICHLEETAKWTVRHLEAWYGVNSARFEHKINRHYPEPEKAVGLNWLKSDNQYTRLVGAWHMAFSKSQETLPQVIDMLNDPYLLCRQFTQKALEDSYAKDFRSLGYRFYLNPEERKGPIEAVRKFLLESERAVDSKTSGL